MNSCNRIISQGNRVSRINNLVSRMLANRDEPIRSASRSESCEPANAEETPSTSELAAASVKRNLFGIRLNHDQLKQDLNTMWKEQLEMKQKRWNFDFENLKPVSHSSPNTTATAIKWKPIAVALQTSSNDSLASTVIAKDEIVGSSSYFRPIVTSGHASTEINIFREFEPPANQSTSDHEPVAYIPQFYKVQRVYKLHENRNRMNLASKNNNSNTNSQTEGLKLDSKLSTVIKSDTNKVAKTVAQKTLNLTGKVNDENAKASNHIARAVRRPRALKRTTEITQLNAGKIITFSENRKDTLRSATTATTTRSFRSPTPSLVQSVHSAFTIGNNSTRTVGSGAVSGTTTSSMKQQSLLDMFKQRKPRRNNQNNDNNLPPVTKTNDYTNATTRSGHFLRSQSATNSATNRC